MDRNKLNLPLQVCGPESLSARRAWIEIVWRAGPPTAGPVALRKESVDRNYLGGTRHRQDVVALRKESVDRNGTVTLTDFLKLLSLSARRAWIEIIHIYLEVHKNGCRSPQGERG